MDSWSFDSCRVSISLAFWFAFMSLASLASGLLVFKELRQLWEWLCAATPQSLQSGKKALLKCEKHRLEMLLPTFPVISWCEVGEVPLWVLAPCPGKYQWELQLRGKRLRGRLKPSSLCPLSHTQYHTILGVSQFLWCSWDLAFLYPAVIYDDFICLLSFTLYTLTFSLIFTHINFLLV